MVRRTGWLILSLIFFCGVALLAAWRLSRPPAPPIPLAALNQGKPVSDEEAIAFGAEFGEAIASGDEAEVLRLFDVPAMVDLIAANLEVLPGGISHLTKSLEEAIGRLWAKPYGKRGGRRSYISAIRVHERDSDRWLILRIVSPDGALQYAEVALARRRGKIRVVDVYNSTGGGRTSLLMRQWLIVDGVRRDREPSGWERDCIDYRADLQAMMKAKRAGHWRKGLAIYRRLPASLRHNQGILYYRIVMAHALIDEDEAGYLAAIDDFQGLFPDEAGVELSAVDAHLIRKDYGEALACIDRSDKDIGGDPYLDVMRANVQLLSGDAASAKECATRASVALPDNPHPLYSLVEISLSERAFGDTLALLRKLRDEFEMGFPNMATGELFAEFIKSPEYQEWIQE